MEVRPRRLRRTAALRRLVSETRVEPRRLVLPMFVREGLDAPRPIASMPGVVQHSRDSLRKAAVEAAQAGIGGIMLFGVPVAKDAAGSGGTDPDGILNVAIRDVVAEVGDATVVMGDLCLDEFTSHGHCGVLEGEHVENDATLELLARTAVSHVEAGADIVAPSDMMDGRVGAIRRALDEAGHSETPIVSYAAKYASAFYGPFREAADSAPAFGDRRSYQMDPANSDEAVREALLDIEEGADVVMVKPALAYLDVIRQARDRFPLPIAAYNVSGEYSMVKAAAERGWVDGPRVMNEILTSIKRAGADLIITYHALEFAMSRATP